IVGMVLSSALCRCQTPERGITAAREPFRNAHAEDSEGVPVVQMRGRQARLAEARPVRLTTYPPGRQPRLLACGPMPPQDLERMRAAAREAALVGGKVV